MMGYDYGPASEGMGWVTKAIIIAIVVVTVFILVAFAPSIMESIRPKPRPVVEDSSAMKEYQLFEGASVTVTVTVRNAGGDGNVIITVSVYAPGTSTYTKSTTVYMVANARVTEEFSFKVGDSKEDYEKSWNYDVDVQRI